MVDARAQLFTITDLGLAKLTPWDDFPMQKRGGKGVQMAKLAARNNWPALAC
jgi:DNA gyrase/topoisomerase IV subunit A